jgi:hypothetical protein
VGFAVLGVVIKALDDAGTAAGASGLNVSLDAQLVADIKSIAAGGQGRDNRYGGRGVGVPRYLQLGAESCFENSTACSFHH